METIVLVIHLLIAFALIGVILLQRSEGGGLGIGGGSSGGGMGGFMSARGTANLLTRTTAILAVMFVTTSLILAILAGEQSGSATITIDDIEGAEEFLGFEEPEDTEPDFDPAVPLSE